MGGEDSDEKPEPSAIARPGQLESFAQAEAKAREILRSRGLSEAQIDLELRRAKRDQMD